ncbi:hypothetical protein QYM36_012282 [Artemia franciscana]|uniref:S1 motif domain-containing protein n=1 Tax=Artemia franciscana TaxID=6661 RepID=A0AA88L397_ARTSF|nr:hypothetical protein QYM36_012282 [Artemia franciscana]
MIVVVEEGENEEELDELERRRLKKLKGVKESDDEKEEDNDERLRKKLKDLIDDAQIEKKSGNERGSEGSYKGRKRRREEDELDDNLEEEDFELLEKNLGVKLKRKKQFRRVQRLEDDKSEEEEGDGREIVANELFEGSDQERENVECHERLPQAEENLEAEEESDTDDFIVDDEGKPIDGRRKRPIFTDHALQTAQDTFGVHFDFDKFMGNEEAEEEESDVEYEEDGGRQNTKKIGRKKTTRKSIFEVFEPSELERCHFTDFDFQVRETDVPERMQLRMTPVTSASESELDKEAEWIYREAFLKSPVSSQDWYVEYRRRLGVEYDVLPKIKKTLDHMRNQNLEVPFIAFYRKEIMHPAFDINDLWRIYKFDEKWCQLQNRKNNVIKLFKKMRKYQEEKTMAAMDKPLDESMRKLKDEDIQRLEDASSPEEIKDNYIHFMLYYGDDVPLMQEADRQKQREEYKRRIELREIRRQESMENGEEGDELIEEEVDEPLLPNEDETVQQARKNDLYSVYRRAGLDGLAKRFGLTAEQFAENLRDGYQRHKVDQYPGDPIECASEFGNSRFSDPKDALRAAKYMVAMQLAREPLVRHCVRKVFYERASINVAPTKDGIKAIDENHPLYALKYVKDKPIRTITDDQFLKLVSGETDKLIKVEFQHNIKGTTNPSYLEEIKQLYIRGEFSRQVEEWNKIRGEAIEQCIQKMLYPAFTMELQTLLVKEAHEFIFRACSHKLSNILKIAPYHTGFPDEEENEWDTKEGIRVLSIAYVPDFNSASFGIMLSPDGEAQEMIRFEHLLKRRDAYQESDRRGKLNDLSRLKDFIFNKKPHVICVGSESREAERVIEDIKNVVKELVDDKQFPAINVELVDDSMAKVYAVSKQAEMEFREFPELLRVAVSLGRRLQDPLLEFSQLCNPDNEILCLKYHPLQDQLSDEELLEVLYYEFINRSNEVGVDINRAINFPHTSYIVQFVCGLGPRKATALMKMLKQTNQRLENRTQLVTHCHMGPKVFVNCAGFIKIDMNSVSDSTKTCIEVLDGTRVHPETYEWARKMAMDALEYEEEYTNPGDAIADILQDPEKLKELDLDAFASELERQSFGNKLIALYDIREELNNRYKDPRQPYRPPDTKEKFQLLIKESPDILHRGKLVQVILTNFTRRKPQRKHLDHAKPVRNEETGLWQCPFCSKNDYPDLSEVWSHFDAGDCQGTAQGIQVCMDNGISGFIPVKSLSDSEGTNPEERVKPGQLIYSRIMKVDEEKFKIICTSKTSDLVDKDHFWKPQRDPYYDTEAENKDLTKEEDFRKANSRQIYTKRVIVHPNFQNISYKEAEEKMALFDQGDVIVRPSSKGSNHLTVTWKVTDGIYQHIDVKEEGKENDFSIGQVLRIGDDEFEDLDEIIARHVNPLAANARDIIDYKYYKDFNLTLLENTHIKERDKTDEYLREEKKKNPGKINYLLCPSKEFPGKFLLSYMPRDKLAHEYITVTPEGFRLRGQLFDTFNQTLVWFKEHFKDRMPRIQARTPQAGDQTPEVRSVSGYAGTQTPGAYSAFGVNTPYTPSGQTPFRTPYTSQTPRYTAPVAAGYSNGGMNPRTPSYPSSS